MNQREEVDPVILATDAFVCERVNTARERIDLYITMAFREVLKEGISERTANLISTSVRTIFNQALKLAPNPRISRNEDSSR